MGTRTQNVHRVHAITDLNHVTFKRGALNQKKPKHQKLKTNERNQYSNVIIIVFVIYFCYLKYRPEPSIFFNARLCVIMNK